MHVAMLALMRGVERLDEHKKWIHPELAKASFERRRMMGSSSSVAVREDWRWYERNVYASKINTPYLKLQ